MYSRHLSSGPIFLMDSALPGRSVSQIRPLSGSVVCPRGPLVLRALAGRIVDYCSVQDTSPISALFRQRNCFGSAGGNSAGKGWSTLRCCCALWTPLRKPPRSSAITLPFSFSSAFRVCACIRVFASLRIISALPISFATLRSTSRPATFSGRIKEYFCDSPLLRFAVAPVGVLAVAPLAHFTVTVGMTIYPRALSSSVTA